MSKSGAKLLASARRLSRRQALLVAGLTAAIGIIVVIKIFAAGSFTAFEPESGTLASPATVISDSSASGGQAVKFSNGSSGSTDFCSSSPMLTGVMPTASNTGVPAGTSLTNSGGFSANTPGQVISALNVTGTITVNANNVTIQNSKINPTGQYWGILIPSGVTGTKILHNEIYTVGGGYEGIMMPYSVGTFVCGNYLHDFENPMTIGDQATIQANFENQMNDGPNGGCDDDGIEMYHGNHIKIWGNNIFAYLADGHTTTCVNSALYTGDIGNVPEDDIDINGNWIGGGGFTLRVELSGPNHDYPVTNVQVRNNKWWYTAATAGTTWGPVAVRARGIISNWSNNTWMGDGTTIPNPNP